MLEAVTPLILTFNEAPNIGRALAKLDWAREIVIVDSCSTDETLEIANQHASVRIVQRPFDTFAGQCNFGLEQVQTPWVLSMDADYILSDEMIEELKVLRFDNAVSGYRTRFVYCVHGKSLRSTLYPPRTVLYRKDRANYRDEGHGHRVRVEGLILDLRGLIFHDDRKPLNRWVSEQSRYMVREARHLLSEPAHQLSLQDRLRLKIVAAPVLVAFYTLIWKRLILDGWPGWYYVFQRTLAELLLSLRLIEAHLGSPDRKDRDGGEREAR